MINRNLWNEVTKNDDDEDVARPLTVACLSATLPPGFARDVGLRAATRDYVSPFDAAYTNSMLFIPRVVSEEDIDEKSIVRMQAILDSMTAKEREYPQIINGSRKKRVAKGSGTSVQEINRLLKQYLQMKKMMKTFSKGLGARKFGKMMKGLPPEFLQ